MTLINGRKLVEREDDFSASCVAGKLLAKKLKPFIVAELVRNCIRIVVDCLCPERNQCPQT